MSAGIGPLLASNWPNAILEGENTVLLLQIARELLKSYQKTLVGDDKTLVGTLKYLGNSEYNNNYSCPSDKAKYRLTATYVDMFAATTVRLIQKSANKIANAMGEGISGQDAFDKIGAMLIIEAAKMHTILFTLRYFEKVIKSMAEGPNKIALHNLALLFSVDSLHTYAAQIIDTKTITPQAMAWTKELYSQLLDDIHPDAMGLVEVWGYIDEN